VNLNFSGFLIDIDLDARCVDLDFRGGRRAGLISAPEQSEE
jgi:hypothetical protein